MGACIAYVIIAVPCGRNQDHSVFAIPEFDASEYANAVLSGEPYPPPSTAIPSPVTGSSTEAHVLGQPQMQGSRPRSMLSTLSVLEPAREDISVAISKLDLGIEDASKQIKALVTAHHEDLLLYSSNTRHWSGLLASVRQGLDDVELSIHQLRRKIRLPYESLQMQVTRLQRIHYANNALRRIGRFFVLEKRLETLAEELARYELGASWTSEGERDPSRDAGAIDGKRLSAESHEEKGRVITKAALTITELGTFPAVSFEVAADLGAGALLDDGSDIEDDQRDACQYGATTAGRFNHVPLCSVNIVAAYIPFISDTRAKVTKEVEAMVIQGLTALDQSVLASSLQAAYNLQMLPQLVAGLMKDLTDAAERRIRNAFDLLSMSKEIIAKVSQSQLYKSRVRTEPTSVTAPQFAAALWARLESLIEQMSGCCVKVYTLEKVLNLKRDPATGVSFLDVSMKARVSLENKPSSTFWASLGMTLEKCCWDAAKSSTFLQQTLSSGYLRLLRLFHEFFASIALHTDTVYTESHQSPETVVVLRALSTFEGIYLSRSLTRLNEAVSQAFLAGTRVPPNANDGIAIARLITNELDSARFDPLLVRAVAKNVATTLDNVATKADALISTERSAVSLLGPLATPQQVLNGQVASCLYYSYTKLSTLMEDHPQTISALIQPGINKILTRYDCVIDPLLAAIRNEIAAVISRIHRVDLQKSADSMAGMTGPSLYMKDLADKLDFVKTSILSNFAQEIARSWIPGIVKYVIRTFVLHASIASPLTEVGKLQLTTDMTELEFALSAFLIDNLQGKRGGSLESIGEEYKMLRAMRPLLFLENSHLGSSERTAGLPPLVVLHHILVRSPIPLPHTLHGWQETEYVRWIEDHSPQEAYSLIESSLNQWQHESGAGEYIQLAWIVLRHAKGER
ncbi:Golgi transport complex subunit 5-domain-containing protein [Pisolithus thermaeus]|nr:Golgi transport complex subunit 5-domain-containing protein [Pisolithus croceorrhizus]KAI6169436.1 Golgi transport complex subunit 5-domain-containing protein [Pisolithus thermaeus]